MRTLSVLENLTRIRRYAGNLTVKSESVSDHVWCMITLALEYFPRYKKLANSDLNLQEVIYGIALHDIDEALYTDIPRPFKHRNKKINQAIQDTVDEILEEVLEPEIISELKRVEDKTTELGLMIKLFDIGQCGLKMKSEIMLGNVLFKTEINNVFEWLEDTYIGVENMGFNSSIVEGFQDLISEFQSELKSIQ